jgi:hypothetical protein
MTLPDERYRAVQRAAQFLQQLCNPAVTPRVPKEIRREAAAVLRHFPSDYDLQQLELAAPHVVQQRMEPVHRMIAAYAIPPEYDDHEGSTLD